MGPIEPAEKWISGKFAKKPLIRDANLELLKKGFHFGETTVGEVKSRLIEEFGIAVREPSVDAAGGVR